jgi:hypothetical protein
VDPLGTVELDVDVDSPAASERETVVEPASVPVPREGPARREVRAPIPSVRPEGASAGGASEVPGVAPPAESADRESWTFSPTGAASDSPRLSSVALDDAIRNGVRTTVAERRTKTDPLEHVLGQPSHRDIELGLFPGGDLVGLVRDTVRTSSAPLVGHATFELEVDGAGATSVRVLDSSSDQAVWDDVAQAIARAARARKAATTSSGRGFALTLEVTSATQSVSGRTPTNSALTKALRAIDDPLDAVIDSRVPARRVVAARVVDAHFL